MSQVSTVEANPQVTAQGLGLHDRPSGSPLGGLSALNGHGGRKAIAPEIVDQAATGSVLHRGVVEVASAAALRRLPTTRRPAVPARMERVAVMPRPVP